MTSSLGSRDNRALYRPENKSITFVITEVCTQIALYLCQMILKQLMMFDTIHAIT